ncbi:MAG: AAA family ATPase [Candidatus Aenigmatarchaeota archaeon]
MERNKYFKVVKTQRGFEYAPGEEPEHVTFDELKGYEDEQRKLRNRLNRIKDADDDYLREENMIFLAGLPGTGKTDSLKAFMNKLPENCKCINIPKHSMGGGFDLVRELSNEYPQYNYFPVVEDVDIATGKDRDRGPGTNILLENLDSTLGTEENIIVLSTSNMPEKIDDAILRPGRMSTFIRYEQPEKWEKEEIVKHYEEEYSTEVDEKLKRKIKNYESTKNPITPDHIRAIVWEYKQRNAEAGPEEGIDPDDIWSSKMKRDRSIRELRESGDDKSYA